MKLSRKDYSKCKFVSGTCRRHGSGKCARSSARP